MGKSDSLMFAEYSSMLARVRPDSIAFLGFSGENEFTASLPAQHRDFFDLALGNWEINSEWDLGMRYDLIVSTRCPYFARDPLDFVMRCKRHTTSRGRIFLDWGLGDHWRFDLYKVGWVRDGEHEFAYSPENHLHSCLWRDEFEFHPEVKNFWDNVRDRFSYPTDARLSEIVRREVPSIVDYSYDEIRFKFLWPESPQLYIMTLI